MKQFFGFLWTFEYLFSFDQLFSSNLPSDDNLCTNRWYDYLSENVFCLKNDKIVTRNRDILEKLGNKKDKKIKTCGLVKKIKRTISFKAKI